MTTCNRGCRPVTQSYASELYRDADAGTIETMAYIADFSSLHIYRSICLIGRLRSFPFKADILVCRIVDDAILRMEFLI